MPELARLPFVHKDAHVCIMRLYTQVPGPVQDESSRELSACMAIENLSLCMQHDVKHKFGLSLLSAMQVSMKYRECFHSAH